MSLIERNIITVLGVLFHNFTNIIIICEIEIEVLCFCFLFDIFFEFNPLIGCFNMLNLSANLSLCKY